LIAARDVPQVQGWTRKRLFITLVHNATSQTEYLCLPEERTITVSSQINL
jgi:hypothetical protein